MQLQIITLYCVCDTYLKQKGHQDDPQAQITQAEVMTTALVAAWFFAGNLRLACAFLREERYIPRMVSESRFNRLLHRVTQADWQGVLALLSRQSPATAFVIDSCPAPVCRDVRAGRRHLYPDAQAGKKGDAYLGYCAAKEEWYFGLKAHVVVAENGRPVEVLLLCGWTSPVFIDSRLSGRRVLWLLLMMSFRRYVKGYQA